MKMFITLIADLNKQKGHRANLDLLQQVHIYKAYGNLILENYYEAVCDYKEAEKINSQMEPQSAYNKFIALGLHSFKNQEFLLSIEYFERASQLFPKNQEPYLLLVLT